jgi:hypothetical protein
MNKDKMMKLYELAKDSGLFYNMIPIIPLNAIYKFDYFKIYGKNKHNLPHDFYLGVKDRKVILVAHRTSEVPLWITYPNTISRAPGVEWLMQHQKDIEEVEGWPYMEPFKTEFRGSRVITTEEVMQLDLGPAADFVIFNLNLFS